VTSLSRSPRSTLFAPAASFWRPEWTYCSAVGRGHTRRRRCRNRRSSGGGGGGVGRGVGVQYDADTEAAAGGGGAAGAVIRVAGPAGGVVGQGADDALTQLTCFIVESIN
jgi:hypothetical protein